MLRDQLKTIREVCEARGLLQKNRSNLPDAKSSAFIGAASWKSSNKGTPHKSGVENMIHSNDKKWWQRFCGMPATSAFLSTESTADSRDNSEEYLHAFVLENEVMELLCYHVCLAFS